MAGEVSGSASSAPSWEGSDAVLSPHGAFWTSGVGLPPQKCPAYLDSAARDRVQYAASAAGCASGKPTGSVLSCHHRHMRSR